MSALGRVPTSDSPDGATSKRSGNWRIDGRVLGSLARADKRSAFVALRRDDRIADRGVEFELERRRAERLAGHAAPTAPRPVCPHLVRPAGSVGDATVKRLNRQPAVRAPVDQRVKAPAEPVDLDDVARLDSLESHRSASVRTRPARSPAPPALAPRLPPTMETARGLSECWLACTGRPPGGPAHTHGA